jgi:hypothetical protein
MSGVTQIKIKESVEELRGLMKESRSQRKPVLFKDGSL